jgi:hypothetical protein
MICKLFVAVSQAASQHTEGHIISATSAVPEKVVAFWEVVFGVSACELAANYRHAGLNKITV